MHRDPRQRFTVRPVPPDLRPEPRLGLAVLTCMDVRGVPDVLLGLEPGDAHVLRNAGAVVTDDVLRSLALSSRLLGTHTVYVVGHTDCALGRFDEEELRMRIPGSEGATFHAFASVEESVGRGVEAISGSPLLPRRLRVEGWVYDVRTGALDPVV